jgi:hypothetical protein
MLRVIWKQISVDHAGAKKQGAVDQRMIDAPPDYDDCGDQDADDTAAPSAAPSAPPEPAEPRPDAAPVPLARCPRIATSWPREDAVRRMRAGLERELIGRTLAPGDVAAIALAAVRLATADPDVPADEQAGLAADATWEVVERTWPDVESLGPGELAAIVASVAAEFRELVARDARPASPRQCCAMS